MAGGFRVQTKYDGGDWRTVRTWPNPEGALEDAHILAAQVRTIPGVRRGTEPFTIAIHPYVRVMHQGKVVVSFDASRQAVA